MTVLVERAAQLRRSGRALNVTLEVDALLDVGQVCAVVERSLSAHPALVRHAVGTGDGPAPLRVLIEEVAPGPDQRARAFERAEEFSADPVPGTHGPRLQVLLLRLVGAHARSLLVLALDPTVCDAWSATILTDELSDAVVRLLDGLPLEPLEVETPLAAGAGHAASAEQRAAAVAAAAPRLEGCSATWTAPGPAPDGSPRLRALLDLPDDVAGELRARCRVARTSPLAPVLVALQLLQPDPVTPRAVVSTLVGREAEPEWQVVGHLATDVWVPVRLRGLAVADAVTAVRNTVLEVLASPPASWLDTAGVLTDDGAGATLSVLYLPAELSGGSGTAAGGAGPSAGSGAPQAEGAAPSARVSRAAVSVCPTGADVDLCVIEHPPVDADGLAPALRLVAEVHRPGCGFDAETFLAAWAATITALSRCDWAATGWPSLLAAPTEGAS